MNSTLTSTWHRARRVTGEPLTAGAASDPEALAAVLDEVILDVYALAMLQTGAFRQAERITNQVIDSLGRRVGRDGAVHPARLRSEAFAITAERLSACRAGRTRERLARIRVLTRRVVLLSLTFVAATHVGFYLV